MKRIKVLIVDDSAVVRQVVSSLLNAEPDIETLGAVADPLLAMARMKHVWPDVIVLDIEMPRMDGISFLRKLMDERPTPVVICSTLTEQGTRTTLDALAAGATCVISKPRLGLKQFLYDSAAELLLAIRNAAAIDPGRLAMRKHFVPPPAKLSADAVLPQATIHPVPLTTDRIVVIGTSTGGTVALELILTSLPATAPAIVIVQHMPEKFTEAFAQRLDEMSQISVKEAEHNDRVMAGRALIAPGGKHMLLRRSGAHYHVDVTDGPLVNRHRPSVDVLFRSAAHAAGPNALGIIMTGMGDDGARGMKEMALAGAHTLAQDEESCVVFGMPKEAIRHGGVKETASLDKIADAIMRYAH